MPVLRERIVYQIDGSKVGSGNIEVRMPVEVFVPLDERGVFLGSAFFWLGCKEWTMVTEAVVMQFEVSVFGLWYPLLGKTE